MASVTGTRTWDLLKEENGKKSSITEMIGAIDLDPRHASRPCSCDVKALWHNHRQGKCHIGDASPPKCDQTRDLLNSKTAENLFMLVFSSFLCDATSMFSVAPWQRLAWAIEDLGEFFAGSQEI